MLFRSTAPMTVPAANQLTADIAHAWTWERMDWLKPGMRFGAIWWAIGRSPGRPVNAAFEEPRELSGRTLAVRREDPGAFPVDEASRVPLQG